VKLNVEQVDLVQRDQNKVDLDEVLYLIKHIQGNIKDWQRIAVFLIGVFDQAKALKISNEMELAELLLYEEFNGTRYIYKQSKD